MTPDPADYEFIDLTSYDFILINSSAGKDSQAMLDYIVECAKDCGVPMSKLVVVHSDLGRVEWSGTPALAYEQAKHYGLRFEIVKRKGRVYRGNTLGDLLDHVQIRGMWPSPTNRWCTSDHKRGQVSRLITQLGREAQENGVEHPRILNCMGMRAEESPGRAKLVDFEYDHRASCKTRTVDRWLPIHHWTVQQVWNRIKASGVPHHYAYDLGMPRLSCCFCIFAPRTALLLAAKHNPELLDKYVQVEEQIQHKFRLECSMQDLKDAVEAGEADRLTPEDLGTGTWNM